MEPRNRAERRQYRTPRNLRRWRVNGLGIKRVNRALETNYGPAVAHRLHKLYRNRTKEELMEVAVRKNIKGRSKMNKEQLRTAIVDAFVSDRFSKTNMTTESGN